MPRPSPAPIGTECPLYTVDREAYRAARAELHRQLAPVGILHLLIVDQLALAAERLRRAAEWEERVAPGDPAWSRYQAQAERSFWKAIAELRRLDKAEKPGTVARPTAAIAPTLTVHVEEPEAEAVVVVEPPVDEVGEPGDWRSRIDRGPSGVFRWPVLKGTSVKVDDVMSLIEDGWAEEEVFSRYPSVSRAGLRACRECDAEGLAGPFVE